MTQPKYQVIEQTLRARITDGTYPEGSIIPKEVDLAAEFAVSRPTIRQAIRILVNQGLLERKQHRGTLVRQSKIAQQFTHVIQSYNQEIAANGRCSRTDVLGLYTQLATPEVQQALHLPDDAQVYRLVRLRFADDEPVVLVTSYLPSDTFARTRPGRLCPPVTLHRARTPPPRYYQREPQTRSGRRRSRYGCQPPSRARQPYILLPHAGSGQRRACP